MNVSLKKLVDAASKSEMTSHQREEQRRSFAYGNTKIENDKITRQMIDEQAVRLANSGG
jgi:hypothetical protein